MKSYLLPLFALISINSMAEVSAVLPNLSKDFSSIRDFSTYQNEAYFSVQSPLTDKSVIIRVQKINKQWSKPQIASFSGEFHDIEAFIAPNGLKLYFASNRPLDKDDKSTDYNLWYVSRKNSESNWSKPISMGSLINTDKNEFYPSISSNGNLYFTTNRTDSKGKDDIYISEFRNGEYQKPYSLSENINSEGDEYNAYIAPNESYIIFGAYKRQDSIGSGDLYMSKRDKDGKWYKASNLGNTVNSKYMDYCPFVDTKNNLLYFTSTRNKPHDTKFNTITELISSFNHYQNGMSRIYKIDI